MTSDTRCGRPSSAATTSVNRRVRFCKVCGDRLAEITERMPEIWWTVPAELTGVDGGEEMLEALKYHKPLFTTEEERILDIRVSSILTRLASTPEAI